MQSYVTKSPRFRIVCRSALMISSGCIALAAGTAGAQEAQTGAQVAQADADIVVTAQRRAQSIQDVPIALTAFSQDSLRDRGVTQLQDVAVQVPNVQLQNFRGLGQPTWVIRGVALLDFNPNNTPAAAIYVDEVYQSSVVMGGNSLFDIERIEVLKGPQAGLYGRNTTGGAVQVISKSAKIGDTSGYAVGSFGSYATGHLEAAQSIAISDTLALRIAATADKGFDGWQTSIPSGKKWGAPDRQAGRIQILWKPSDRLNVNLKVFGMRDESESPLANALGIYTVTGGTCPAVLAGYTDNNSCLTYDQLTYGTANRLSPAAQREGGKRTLSQPVNQLHNREVGATLKLDYDLGFATLSSVTGYDHFKFGLTDDFAAATSDMLIQQERTTINYVSQEVRLASRATSGISWIVGANYARDTFSDYRSNDISGNLIILTAFGLTPAIGRLDLSYRQKTEYWGLFGQADYDLTEQLSVTGALRYSDDHKEYRDGLLSFPLANITIRGPLSANYDLRDHVTGKASIQYKVNRDALLYASASKGYKSGGFFGGFPTNDSNILPYKEEILWAYELGAKTEWFDRKLTANAAVFYYDHRDAQGFSTIPSPILANQFIYNLTNVGNGRHFGAEVDVTVRPMSGLSIQGNVGYLNAKIDDSNLTYTALDNQVIPFEGRKFDFAPKWSGSVSADYEHALRGDMAAGIHLDYNFRTQLTFRQNLVDQALTDLHGYDLVNGRIYVKFAGGLNVAVFARNLMGEKYFVSRSGDGLGSFQETYGDPRRFGIEISKSW